MSGINSILQTALRSLQVSTQSLAVASNNIANEKTPGYTRQELVRTPAPSTGESIRIGSGVEAVRVEGLRDFLIERRLRDEVSSMSEQESMHEMLTRAELLFNDAQDTGLLPVITKFFNSFHELAIDPLSVNLRDQVRVAAEELSRTFSERSEELKRLQQVANDNMTSDIHSIRGLATRIAEISALIREQEAGGQTANDLRDQRGELVRELSEYVDVAELGDGVNYSIHVGGALLVFDGRSAGVRIDSTSGSARLIVGAIDVTDQIDSGSFAAWAEMRDTRIPAYVAELDQLAYEISQQVNLVHATGYTRGGATGVDFFEPLATAADAARQLGLSAEVLADVGNIAAAANPGGTDNEVAMALGNLVHANTFSGGSVIDQYRTFVFRLASETATVASRMDQHRALLHQLEDRRDAVSGVSIDEESMKILQFQRGYQASANVIRVVDELFQTLLSLGR